MKAIPLPSQETSTVADYLVDETAAFDRLTRHNMRDKRNYMTNE